MRRSVTAAIGVAVLAGSAVALTAPALAAARSARPAAETVPLSVDHVRILYRDSANPDKNETVRLHGKRADHMIELFDALAREPKDAAHCLAMGTASTSVVFKGSAHKWVTSQAICTGVGVSRDGKSMPTLVPNDAWDKALTRHLGHSPIGTG